MTNNKYKIDYSKIKSKDNSLYLSEKPCNDVVDVQRFGKTKESKDFKAKIERCLSDFIHFMDVEEIKTVVVLLTDYQIEEFYGKDLEKFYQKNGFKVIHYPIEDFSIPSDFKSFHKLTTSIVSSLEQGNVLIHCSAGLGRTGLVAAGVATLKGRNPIEAIDLIRKIRFGAIENKNQENFIKKYSEYIDLNETLREAFK